MIVTKIPMVVEHIKEQTMTISYRKRNDALKIIEFDKLYNETLKNSTNLIEKDIHDSYRIVISLNNPARKNDLIEDVLSFCKKYDFLKGFTCISSVDNIDFTIYDEILNIDFYLTRLVKSAYP